MDVSWMHPNQRVYILPIREYGRIKRIRQDVRGEPLIDVIRESDGVSHVCRPNEIGEIKEIGRNQGRREH